MSSGGSQKLRFHLKIDALLDDVEGVGIVLKELLQRLAWGTFLPTPAFQHLIRWQQDHEIHSWFGCGCRGGFGHVKLSPDVLQQLLRLRAEGKGRPARLLGC